MTALNSTQAMMGATLGTKFVCNVCHQLHYGLETAVTERCWWGLAHAAQVPTGGHSYWPPNEAVGALAPSLGTVSCDFKQWKSWIAAANQSEAITFLKEQKKALEAKAEACRQAFVDGKAWKAETLVKLPRTQAYGVPHWKLNGVEVSLESLSDLMFPGLDLGHVKQQLDSSEAIDIRWEGSGQLARVLQFTQADSNSYRRPQMKNNLMYLSSARGGIVIRVADNGCRTVEAFEAWWKMHNSLEGY